MFADKVKFSVEMHLCEQVNTLSQEADRLRDINPEHADQIQAKQAEIQENWNRLSDKVGRRVFVISLT